MQTKAASTAIHFSVLALVVVLLFFPDIADAAASGTNDGSSVFGNMYNTVKGWITGVLGKLIALLTLAVGLIMGVAKQSIMASLVGLAMAWILYYGPSLIESVFGATLLIG